MMSEHGGCYIIYKLGEGNFRVVFVSMVMLAYTLIGAAIFQAIEGPSEDNFRETYRLAKESFISKYPDINASDLEALLSAHANAAMRGHLQSSVRRWDYTGALYYVVTLVTTIGYGMTTPCTNVGRVVTMIYGFLGCSLNVLCMNLLLERHIVLFTAILSGLQKMLSKVKARFASNVVNMESGIKPIEEEWKPTIAKLLITLVFTIIVITLGMSVAYHLIENWTYLNSVYFCFVTYTTIGFGDLVAQQNDNIHIFYNILNGISIYVGVTLLYSIFNIVSILLKDWSVKFSMWVTRCCLPCYYDPNLNKAMERGRRKPAFVVTGNSGRQSALGYDSRRLTIHTNNYSPSASLTRQQHENNLAFITQEFRANKSRTSINSSGSNTAELKPNGLHENPPTIINDAWIDSDIRVRYSVGSIGLENSTTNMQKHLLRLSSHRSIDTKHLPLTRRASELVLPGKAGRPKSRIQREAGGMNAVHAALVKVNADLHDEATDTDEYY